MNKKFAVYFGAVERDANRRPILQAPHRSQCRVRIASTAPRSSSSSGLIADICSGFVGARTNSRSGPTSFRRHQCGECCLRSFVSIPLKKASVMGDVLFCIATPWVPPGTIRLRPNVCKRTEAKRPVCLPPLNHKSQPFPRGVLL